MSKKLDCCRNLEAVGPWNAHHVLYCPCIVVASLDHEVANCAVIVPTDIGKTADLPSQQIFEPELIAEDLLSRDVRVDPGEADMRMGMPTNLEAPRQLRDLAGMHDGPSLGV